MLTGKEKRKLRANANQIKASVLIGKEGVSEKIKIFIDEAFNNKELLKIKILETCPEDRKQVAAKLAVLPETEVVQILGRTVLLFRPLPDDKD